MPRLQVGYVWHERGNKTEVVLQQRFEAMINPFRGPVSIIMHTRLVEHMLNIASTFITRCNCFAHTDI